MSFVSRLAKLRQENGVTLAQLGSTIGISLRAMKYYASGEREASMSTLIALADYFNVSLDYLVGRSDVPERR